MATKQEKLKQLKARLAELDQKAVSTLGSAYDSIRGYTEKAIADETKAAMAGVRESASLKAIEALARDFDAFKGQINIKPVIEAVNRAERENNERLSATQSDFEGKLITLIDQLDRREESNKKVSEKSRNDILSKIQILVDEFNTERSSSSNRAALIQSEVARVSQELQRINKSLGGKKKDDTPTKIAALAESVTTASADITKVREEIKKLEGDMLKNLSRVRGGGGNANRQILVNGNASTLSKYTDINIIPGSNMGIAVSTNDTTQKTNFTIYSTGGAGTPAGSNGQIQFNDGGSFGASSTLSWDNNASVLTVGTFNLPANAGTDGQYLQTRGNGVTQWASVTAAGGSGITRVTSIITETTSPAAVASKDYMFFVADGVRVHLPSVAGNTNLYTIKNTSASSVLVTAGEGIDGGPSALINVQYESLSFLSDGSVWGIV